MVLSFLPKYTWLCLLTATTCTQSGWGGDYDEPAVEEKSRMRYEGTLMNPEAIQVPKRTKTTHQDVVKDIENSWERVRREYR